MIMRVRMIPGGHPVDKNSAGTADLRMTDMSVSTAVLGPSGGDTKDRLSLSVHSSVKDRAKEFADSQGTSVSALVEEFLGEIVTEVKARRYRPAPNMHDIIRSKLASGETTILRDAVDGSHEVAYLSSGQLVVDAAAPLSWRSMRARARLREQGLPVTTEWLLSREELSELLSIETAERREPVGGKRNARLVFSSLVGDAAAAGSDLLYVSVVGDVARLRHRVDGHLVAAGEIPAGLADEIIAGVFEVSERRYTSEYFATRFNSGLVSGTRIELPEGISSLPVRFLPGPGKDHGLMALLRPATTGRGAGSPAELGFLQDQVDGVLRRAARRGGLFVVADSGDDGLGALRTLRAFMTVHPILGRGGQAVLIGDFEGEVSGVIQIGDSHSAAVWLTDDLMPEILVLPNVTSDDHWKFVASALRRGVQVWVAMDAANATAALAVAVENLAAHRIDWIAASHGMTAIWQHRVGPLCARGVEAGAAPDVVAEIMHLREREVGDLRRIMPQLLHRARLEENGGTAAELARRLAQEGRLDPEGVAEVFGTEKDD